jgi:phospholipase C
MADTVMTLGRQSLTALIRGTNTTPSGDFREISFRCHFSADAVNGGPPPAPPPQIRVTLTGRADASAIVVDIQAPNGPSERLSTSRLTGAIPWTRRPLDLGRIGTRSSPTMTQRLSSTALSWSYQDPFEDLLPDWVVETPPLVDPRPPGGGGGGGSSRRFVRVLDPAVDPVGTWRVRVRNRGWEDVQLSITVDYPETIQVLRETRIPFQLINRAFAEAMLALGLGIKIDHGQARVSFDRGFKALTGLDDLTFSVSDRIRDINLKQYNIEITNEDGMAVICAGVDLEERGSEIGAPGPDIDIENMAIVLRVFLLYGYPGHDFFSTAMRRQDDGIFQEALLVLPYLDAHPDLVGFWASFFDTIFAVTGPLGLSPSSIKEIIQDAISTAETKLFLALLPAARYFYDVIMHLVERDELMHSIRADDGALIVQHHRKPSLRDLLDPAFPTIPETVAVTTASRLEEAEQEATQEILRRSGEFVARSTSVGRSGVREGDIDHIVVLMLENRSFDHMLGYRGLADVNVNGLSGNESNLLTPEQPPYPVFHLSETSGIPSPAHGFEATLQQINGGEMSGFVKNYDERVDDPSLVMSYYTATELPMYEFLASNYAICDNWHSAHPGETQCNRFCTLTGRTPELDNFDVTDRRLAYFRGNSVFELLSQTGVDWVYAEGNVAFLRMFDRYRLDVRNVIPFRDDFNQNIEDTFEGRVSDGRLPNVSFIDPRYIDVPPAWGANDDLPPADVCRGQELVRRVYRLLSEERTWEHTLLIVTYDEHGGFFDHSPPLGTPVSADPSPVPRVHPEGVEHLGVRVPAFLVTPWIDAGTVIHTALDHTSILKTILERFAPSDFPIQDVFGERTAAANGLFSGLRSTARLDRPKAPGFKCEDPVGPRGPTFDLERREFQTAMRLLGIPARYRDRLVT